VIPGDVRAPLLSSDQPLSFWGGYDFHNGKIIDARHPLAGQVAAGKILALPFTRGSSTTTAILLESVKAGTAPAAILSSSPDSFFALASIIADEMYGSPIPLVTLNSNDFSTLLHATSAHIHADGTIIVFSQTADLDQGS
jgi:predicted aconitase with swiveling domain